MQGLRLGPARNRPRGSKLGWRGLPIACLLLVGGVATAAPRPWRAGVYLGTSLDVPLGSPAGIVGASLGHLFRDRLQVELSLRYVAGGYRHQLDVTGAIGARFQLGWLSLEPGSAFGISALNARINPYDTLWVAALLVRPRLLMTIALPLALELTLELVTVSVYYTDIWIIAWEPTCGLAYRF